MKNRIDQIQHLRFCYITITIEQLENPDEHYNSISSNEIKFHSMQRYFFEGNNVTFNLGKRGILIREISPSEISSDEIGFPSVQHYFIRGNNAIDFSDIVALKTKR